jgi:hypothetical protein
MLYLITTTDWVRITLLYSHLVLCAFAITAVLTTDIAIMRGSYCKKSLAATAKAISVILAALWLTGLAIIYIDTSFEPAVLLSKTKLVLKLACVITLTLNGIVLHHICFPVMTRENSSLSLKDSAVLATTGALSTSHWMLAAFVGMSKPLGRLPLETLLPAYGLFVCSVLVTSLFFIPLLFMRLRAPAPVLIALNNH